MCSGEKFQGWTTLKAIFILSSPFMCHSQTALQISDSPSPVEATLGENVTIPCVLTDPRQPQRVLDLDLATDSVRWDMKSLNGSLHKVCLFTQGINTINIQRSNIDGKEFKRGHASLTMYNVQGSDEGEYTCNVYVAGNKLTAVRTVEVSEPAGSHNLILGISIVSSVLLLVGIAVAVYFIQFKKRPPKISGIAGIHDLVHGESSALSWMVSNFRPKNIEINAYLERGDKRQKIRSWKYPLPQSPNNGDVDTERGEAIMLLERQNTTQPFIAKSSFFSYSCPCSTNITPDKKNDKEARLVIEVIHGALKSTLTELHKLNFKGAQPVVEQIIPKHVGQQMELSCRIHSFHPKTIGIKWFKEDEELPMTEYELCAGEDDLYSTTSILMYTPELADIGKTFRCKVNHQSLQNPETREWKLEEQTRPVVEPIISKHVGQQMELSCRIHSFYPKTVDIKWFKEDEELPTVKCEPSKGKDGLYSTTSILMYTPELEHIGKTFKCIVDHQSLRNPETCKWKLEEQSIKR